MRPENVEMRSTMGYQEINNEMEHREAGKSKRENSALLNKNQEGVDDTTY